MKKRNRIALLVIAFLAFAVSAPAIVLYAMGYRLSRSSQSQAVGVVYVATLPSAATAMVDGSSGGATPRALTNLTPGEHVVTVQKEQYESWQKAIPVEPNVVTQLRDIRLFPETRLSRTVLPRTVQFALAPDGRTAAAVTADRHLHVLREDQTVTELFTAPLPFAPTALSWSSDSGALLLKNPKKSGYDVLDLTVPAPRILAIDILQPAISARWDGQIADRVLFLNAAGQLRAYNIHTDASVIMSTQIKRFTTGGRYIVLATEEKVELLDLQGQLQATWNLPINVVPTQLQVASDGAIAFIDERGDAYRTTSGQDPVQIGQGVKDIQWSPDGALLLMREDRRLSVYNVSLKDTPWLPVGELVSVTQTTDLLQNATWFAGSRYMVYQVGGELRLTDIDTRGGSAVYVIEATNLPNAQAAVGLDGALLYYLKKNGPSSELAAFALTL